MPMCHNKKIYIVYHNDVKNRIPQNETFIASHVKWNDSRDNIAEKEDYSELRTQYYVWKNCKSDYVGFFHYRRYLDCEQKVLKPDTNNIKPYYFQKSPKIFSEECMEKICQEYDVIAPVREYIVQSVYNRYASFPQQDIEDLDLVLKILDEKYPQYNDSAQEYINGKCEYFCNMYIMRWDIFDEYCNWLFSILEEFTKKKKTKKSRTEGYIAERLFGIYFTWLQKNNDVRCGVLPRIHYMCYDDEYHSSKRDCIKQMIIPPCSNETKLLKLKYTVMKQIHKFKDR